jgi:O-antigen ligase
MAQENSSILPSSFANLGDINLGVVLLGLYLLFDFGTFQGIFEIINEYKLPFIVASVSVIYAIYLVATGRVNFRSNTTRIFIVLCLFIIIYSMLSTQNTAQAHSNTTLFLQYLANYLIMVACVKKPSQFILLIDIWLAGIINSSFHTILQGGKIYDSIWLTGENDLPVLCTTAFPFALILFTNYKSKLRKVCYGIAIGFYVLGIAAGGSRGGMLSIFSVAFLCWLFYKNKVRNLLLIIMAAFLVLNFAPDKFFNKMERVKEGTKEATADDRIYLWKIARGMFYDYPILGVGPCNYPFYVLKYDSERRYYHLYLDLGMMKVAHSTPFTWLAEMGILGGIILILLQISMYKNWRFLYKDKSSAFGNGIDRKDSYLLKSINNACAISQVGFWFGALFLSLMIYPFYWILVPFSETWENILLEYKDV